MITEICSSVNGRTISPSALREVDWGNVAELALVGRVKKIHPAVNGHGNVIELDTVEEGGWRSVDSLGRSVLPEHARVTVGAVWVIVAVANSNLVPGHTKFAGDFHGPPCFEIDLRCGSHSKDSFLHLEGEVFIFVAEASLSLSAELHEEGHELVDLVSMDVIWKREWSETDGDIITDGTIEPFSVEDLLEDWVEGGAVGA